jgi:hypothetical protein
MKKGTVRAKYSKLQSEMAVNTQGCIEKMCTPIGIDGGEREANMQGLQGARDV